MKKYNRLSWSGVCWDKGYSLDVEKKSLPKVNLYVTHHFKICFTDSQTDCMQSGSLRESPIPCGAQTMCMFSNNFCIFCFFILNAGM